jgi:integrase
MSSGTGTVYRRKSDGRWVAAIRLNGKRIVRYADTEREAKKRLRELIGREERGTLTPPTNLTVEAWASRWLTMIEPDRRPATIATYQFSLRPVIERIGTYRLDRLTPELLGRMITFLRQDGLGNRRISQSYRVLHTCLNQAVRLDIIGVNPLEKVSRPRYTASPVMTWSLEETKRFIAVCATDGGHYSPMFLFLLGTGLRRGECTALTWGDIDLQNRLVSVDKAVAFVRNRPILQQTKTRAGRRVLSLTGLSVMALDMVPRSLDSKARIFVSGAGSSPTPSNVRSALHRLCDKAEVPRISPHALRHSHVSLLLAAGVDVLTVSRRVGHAKVSVTVDVYGHTVRPDSHAAAAFDKAVGEE